MREIAPDRTGDAPAPYQGPRRSPVESDVQGCETEFYDPKARREFCEDCNPNAGKHNGNWTGGMETSTCKRCESTVEYYPSDKRGIYCSACIESADGLLPDNPSEKGRRVTVNCRACSSEFEIRPARLKSQERGFFCTLECYGERSSATTTSVNTAARMTTISTGTQTFIICSPFGRSTDPRRHIRWTT